MCLATEIIGFLRKLEFSLTNVVVKRERQSWPLFVRDSIIYWRQL